MYNIPTSVEVNGQSYAIRNQGDYRMVLDCFVALNDNELNTQQRMFATLIIFYEYFSADIPDDIEDDDIRFGMCIEKLSALDEDILMQLVKQMYKFFNCGEDYEEDKKKVPKLIDWNEDSQLICSAINKVAGQEIRAIPYMHWWTFMGYYLAIGESPLSNIVGIRYKIVRNEKLEKYERKFQADNPQYFKNINNEVDKEYEEFIHNVWNKGS